jgi:glycine/D-amino acid oxidase-like deaminating enzyme
MGKGMAGKTAEVVICGAGIAGISVAYHLTVNQGLRKVILVDERQPLSLTSDKSTECYRNWWPGPDRAMVSLLNRSIDLMEQMADRSNNIFRLNRRGYLYITADPERIEILKQNAEIASQLGAGPLRFYQGNSTDPVYKTSRTTGFKDQPVGADLILDQNLIRSLFPYLDNRVLAVLHVRRAGWLSAQQLGTYMLSKARDHGAELIRAKVDRVEFNKGQVRSVGFSDNSIASISTKKFVNAAGPFINPVANLLGTNLNVYAELHAKIACNDRYHILPRDAPLLIWSDPQRLEFSEEDRAFLEKDRENRWLLSEFPSGLHTRPEGGGDSEMILILWAYHTPALEPCWPLPIEPQYPEIVYRGLIKMLPKMKTYLGKFPRPVVDGGYYLKTPENRPLIGPMEVEGAYLIGALSGFGVMAACGAGELLADHILGNQLPEYAPAFSLDRYKDPKYHLRFDAWKDSTQL